MAEGLLTMFGKTYNTVGSADNNLILLTRGDLKIRWGNKFIDLIKNGKINVETNVLKKAKSKDDLSTDGIYLVSTEEGDEVWVRINGSDINITRNTNNNYISYVELQDIDAERKLIALSNIGIYYNTLQAAKDANILTGIVYVIDEGSLYYVKEGNFQKFAYDINIPDSLRIGDITIDGNNRIIYGSNELQLGVNGNNYISLSDKITLNKLLSLDVISSKDFKHTFSGYSLYKDDDDLSCLEIDYIIVRNRIEYQNIIDIMYDQLALMIKEKKLIKGCRYRITDFQNEWEINHEYLDSENKKYYHYWPVIVTANSVNTLEEYGYYCDNEDWIIKYDVDFHYYVYSIVNELNEVINFYTKGRITYLKDEFGNVANFDFKHRLFKYNINSDDRRTWLFTYNASNSTYNTNLTESMEFSNIHTNRDYSLTGDIHNNIIYIKEPYFETLSVTIAGQAQNMDVLVIPEDYIIFTNCATYYPYNNIIYLSSGKYVVTNEFYDNIIGGFILNVQNIETILIHFPFYKNTLGRIYFYGEELNEPFPTTSLKRVAFSNVHTFNNNTIGDIINTYFGGNFIKNICLDITDCTIDTVADNNFFLYDLDKVYFSYGSIGDKISNNIFNGKIETNRYPEKYPIKGNIVDNIFGHIKRTPIIGNLDNNRFNNILPLTTSGNNVTESIIDVTTMSNCTFNNLTGVRFDNSSNDNTLGNGTSTVVSVIFYDEIYRKYYNITDTIFKGDTVLILCKGDMTHTTFNANVSNVKFGGLVGNNSNIIFNILTNVEFKGNVLVIDATGSTIENCIFDGNVNNAVIRGTITNNTFKSLSGGVLIGGTNETIDSVVMLTNLSPGIAEYVESSNGSGYTPVSPFSLTISSVPKLQRSGVKTCYVLTISNKKIFFVLTAADDTTPRGVIVMFNGQINEIPNGYVICDGNNGTPDLRGRFIRMIGNNELVGPKDNSDLETNGYGTRLAYLKKVPAHLHIYDDINHTYTIPIQINNTLGISNSLGINNNLSINNTLSINNSLGINNNLGISSSNFRAENTSLSNFDYFPSNSSTVTIGETTIALNSLGYLADSGTKQLYNSYREVNYGHAHNISGTPSLTGNVSLTGDVSLTGNVGLQGTIGLTGSVGLTGLVSATDATLSILESISQNLEAELFQEAINIEPLAYALIFIMKL